MHSLSSPGTTPHRSAGQAPFAGSMRAGSELTRFHHRGAAHPAARHLPAGAARSAARRALETRLEPCLPMPPSTPRPVQGDLRVRCGGTRVHVVGSSGARAAISR